MIIPAAMKNFVKEHKVYQVSTDKVLLVECAINKQYGETVLVFDGSDIIRARFAYCEEIARVESALNIENQVVKNNMKELMRLDRQLRIMAETFNYGLIYAEPQPIELYCWIDLIFKKEDWNEKQFMHCWESIEKVKRAILDIHQKYIENY